MLASSAPNASNAQLRLWLPLIGVCIFALALRLPQIQESLWLDELHTAWTVSGGWAELPQRAAMGNISPLYFTLLWLSTSLLGLSELALRLPSLLAGTILVGGLFWVVQRWTGSLIAGALTALLAAIDPNCLFFSLEARPYACVQLVGLMQLALFADLVRPGLSKGELTSPRQTWQRIALITLSTLLFYLHYTAALLLVAEGMYLLIAFCIPRLRPHRAWYAWLIDFSIIALMCSPATPHLLAIAGRRENWESAIGRPKYIYEHQRIRLFWAEVYVLVPTALALPLVLFFGHRKSAPIDKRPQLLAPQLLLVTCCFVIPVLTVFILSYYNIARLWLPRYVIVSAVAPMLAAGIIVGWMPTVKLRMVVAGVTFLCALIWVGPFNQWQRDGRLVDRSHENWRQAVAFVVGDESTQGWPVLVRSGLIEADGLIESRDAQLREYCLLPVRSIYAIDTERPLIPLAATQPGRMDADDLKGLKNFDGIWLITPGSRKTAADTLEQVQQALRSSGIAVEEANTYGFGGVRVTEFAFQKETGRQ